MKHDCELIQDLIPLVKDGIASDTSKIAVDLHIQQCSVCRGIFETDMQVGFLELDYSARAEISKAKDYKTRIIKRRKIIKTLVIILSIVLVAVTVVATLQVVKLLSGDTYTTRDIANYGNFSGNIEAEQEGLFSLLAIFPEEIPSLAEVKDFYYFANNGLLDNSYQLYLHCSYDENSFALEKERLESIELSFGNEVHTPVITDTGFDYRAVVTIFGDQNSFEYALIDEDTYTIAYIFAQSMGINKSIVPLEYRPKGFSPPNDMLNELGSYNIYRFEIDDGMPGSTYVIPRIDNVRE